MSATDDLELLVATTEWADDLDAILTRAVSVQDKLALLTACKSAAKGIASVKKALEQEIGALLERGTTDVPEVGRVTVHGKATRKEWDHDGLFRAIGPRLGDDLGDTLLTDPETGERKPPALVAAEVVGAFRTLVSSVSWRLGDPDKGTPGLRTIGLDVDEFCTTDWSYSVDAPDAA